MRTKIILITAVWISFTGSAAFAQNTPTPPAGETEMDAFQSPTVGVSGPIHEAEKDSLVNKINPPMEPSELSPVEYLDPSNTRKMETSSGPR
ncbi:MAG: hypothetical protein K2W78_02140 [Xanthobacteraceae bacterium]|nr:hypothetical protein [Xanthobacteraceae bacterium]